MFALARKNARNGPAAVDDRPSSQPASGPLGGGFMQRLGIAGAKTQKLLGLQYAALARTAALVRLAL